jgi:hypothetical protein
MIKRKSSTHRRVVYEAMGIIMLLSIISVGFVIICHDYPGHGHFEFLHDLLRDDTSMKQISPLFALKDIVELNTGRSDPNLHLINNLCYLGHNKQGNEYLSSALDVLPFDVNVERDGLCHSLSSDLSPPADIVARVGGCYPFSRCVLRSCDHVRQNTWFRHISLFFSASGTAIRPSGMEC